MIITKTSPNKGIFAFRHKKLAYQLGWDFF